MPRRLFAALLVLLVLRASSVAARQADKDRAFAVVPQTGPLKGKTIYASSYALIVGINAYPNVPRKWWLSHAVDDARAMKDVLVRSYGFPAENITLLTDGDATEKRIRNALASFTSFTRIKKDDRVLVYFSGHGQTIKLPGDAPEMGFLVPYDAEVDLADLTNPEPYLRSCIPMRQVWEYLDASPAKHVLVLADACYSGLLAKNRGGEDDRIPDGQLISLASERTRQVITAGRKGETAVELDEVGHGAFTHSLLELLKKQAAVPGEVFTSNQLYSKLFPAVGRATQGKQTPQISNHETEGQFLFVTTPEAQTDSGPVAADSLARAFVRTDPPGAKIYLDGRELADAKTPYTVAVGLGGDRVRSVEIAVELNGERKTSKVALVAGRFTQLPLIQFGAGGVDPARPEGVYDVSSDFNRERNPASPWSFGELAPGPTPDSATFKLYPTNVRPHPDFTHLLTGRKDSSAVSIHFMDRLHVDGQIQMPPRQLIQHPGPNGEYCTSRWTCPVTGRYTVEASFWGINKAPTTTDCHVLVRGAEQYSGFVNGFGFDSRQRYRGSFTLAAGDTIDFAVGWGSNRTWFSDSTAVDAHITRE